MSTPATTEQQEPLSQTTLADCAKSCLESFQKCLSSTGKADKVTASLTSSLLPSLVRVEDQLARFSLWAANLNVFSPRKASLDNRLREASDVKDAIVALLETFDYRIKSCTRLLNSMLTETQVTDSLQEFDETLDNLRDEITLLHKISNTIRRASKETQNAKAVNFFKIRDDEGNDVEPFLQQLFINYIRDRFPGTSEDIRKRLAFTMLLRRKRILYRRERYEKAPIRLQAAVAKPVISHPRPEPTEQIVQGPMKRRVVEASSRSQVQSITKTATTLSPEKFRRASVPSIISVSQTVALSSNDELCFPPPPTAGLMRRYNREKKNNEQPCRQTPVSPPPDDYVAGPTEDTEEGSENADAANLRRDLALSQVWESCVEAVAEVTCPYCFHVLPIREVLDEKKWNRLHVKNDLDAYVCLFEKCDSPEHLYSHSNTWIKHMKEHTLRWRCKSKAHGDFMAETRDDYVDHMKTSHPRKFADAQLDVLADRNAHTIGPLFVVCPLCGLEKSDMPMENHVVGHMRLLALKSLPPSYEENAELDGFDDQKDYLSDSGPGKRSTIQSAFEVGAYEDWDEEASDIHDNDDLVLQTPAKRHLQDGTSSINSEPIPDGPASISSEHDDREPEAKEKKPVESIIDPDCAICGLPGSAKCPCEAEALDIAVKQAENKVILPLAHEIRRWVRDKVQKNLDCDHKTTDSATTETESQCGGSSTNNDLGGVDEGEVPDGPALYAPSGSNNGGLSEALDYYFGLVELRLPADDDPCVRNPPLQPGRESVEESKNPFNRSKGRVRFN